MSKKKRRFLDRLKKALAKTREKFAHSVKALFTLGRAIDQDALDELAEVLIMADVGPRSAQRISDDVRQAYHGKRFKDPQGLLAFLQQDMKQSLSHWDTSMRLAPSGPSVILVVGVNGAGKTTSIAKLASLYRREGKKVLLAAADTYRAAATDQLEVWSKRVKVGLVKHQAGSDPAAVVFDAMDAALGRGVDLLIVDTAGRLQTRENLMRELTKIRDVVARKLEGAPHEVLLVLDATTGQNGISQAKLFSEAVEVTGVFLAKLDGTAKGGIVIGMRDQIDIPVKFVGLGEKPEDVEPFDPDLFVDALFAS